MSTSISLLLAAIGAVLLFAVDGTVEGVDLDSVGVVLLVISGIGLLWGLFMAAAHSEDE